MWPLRNYLWGFCNRVEADIADRLVRYGVIDGFCTLWRFKLENLICSDYTIARDQMIRYPMVSDNTHYTFSFWAFPEDLYPVALARYFQFSKDYYEQKGYRSNMLSVGYRVAQDQNSLLSYSHDGTTMTIDPVSTGNPGWDDFLEAYNNFCSEQGAALPLLNQTDRLTRAQAQKAIGNRLRSFAQARKSYDPDNRLLNDYFQDLLAD